MMNQKITILSDRGTGSFAERLTDLQKQLEDYLLHIHAGREGLLWCRVFLSDAANQLDELTAHPLYTQLLSTCACNYVEQPPLNGSKIALLIVVLPDAHIQKEGTPSQMKVSLDGNTWLFQSVRLTKEEAEGMTPKQQTELCFNRHMEWLKAHHMTLKDNCLRTWLYVRDIDTNYAGVMQGRNAIFAEQGLTSDTHFIASTGIEGNTTNYQAVIGIDFMSAAFQENPQIQYLQALDYLNPTHEYGVAFERGTSYQTATQRHLMLSGTASIDKHGKCLYLGDVEKQIERMFVNIDQLLHADKSSLQEIQYLVVYLRDIADYSWVNSYIQNRFPSLPYIILKAPVCRPAWLIEAETEAIHAL